MLRSIKCAILLTMITIPTLAFAWGAIGHEVICEIAFQETDARRPREGGGADRARQRIQFFRKVL